MSAGQHIDYDALVRGAIQEAKRSVVRSVLTQAAKTGLVGGHHFLIAFNTQAQGVSLSKRLKDKYPLEMTIVLQHRFWDLEVSDDRFEVKLTFDSIPERLAIPFTAIKAFYDPSVPYMMPFDDGEAVGGQGGGIEEMSGPEGVHASGATRRRERMQRRPRSAERTGEETTQVPAAATPSVAAPGEAASKGAHPIAGTAPPAERAKPAVAAVDTDAGKTDTAAAAGAKVLDLSAFRGKKK